MLEMVAVLAVTTELLLVLAAEETTTRDSMLVAAQEPQDKVMRVRLATHLALLVLEAVLEERHLELLLGQEPRVQSAVLQ